jgi:biotin carboxyl carrier protein
VLVAAGDEVAAGPGLVVVEAMKMENELRAPKTGKVKDVNVSAGTPVDAGKVLVVIE